MVAVWYEELLSDWGKPKFIHQYKKVMTIMNWANLMSSSSFHWTKIVTSIIFLGLKRNKIEVNFINSTSDTLDMPWNKNQRISNFIKLLINFQSSRAGQAIVKHLKSNRKTSNRWLVKKFGPSCLHKKENEVYIVP